MTTGTLHINKRSKSTAKEDFAIEDELSAPAAKRKEQLEHLDLLDIFAMAASIGVSQRVNDPAQIAGESYAIGREMLKFLYE